MTSPAPARVRVLFICIGNACRSPMAESIAWREAADIIEPSSAGLYPLGCIAPPTIQTLLANGYSVEGLTSKGISRDAVQNADILINISGNPIERLFSSPPSALRRDQRLENWKVPDPYGEKANTYQTILEELERRVRRLAYRLRHPERAARP